MKKLICFDMDNTIVYSDKAHIVAYNEALEKLGYKKKSEFFLRKLFGMPHLTLSKVILPKADKKTIQKFLKIKHNIFMKKSYKLLKLIPNVGKTLNKLRKNYDLALLSNCSKSTILKTLKRVKLNKNIFKLIMGSENVKRSKPFSDELLKAQKLYKHKPVFMVGDSVYDILAGKKAGVKTIAVLTGNHSKSRLKRYSPNFILKSINELPKLIKN